MGSPRNHYGGKNQYLGGSWEHLGSTSSPMYTCWLCLGHFGSDVRSLLVSFSSTFAHMLGTNTIIEKTHINKTCQEQHTLFQTVFSWNVDASEMRTCENRMVITSVFLRLAFSHNIYNYKTLCGACRVRGLFFEQFVA